ncbi:MAG: hypothetical protein IIT72_03665 [Lachnospiraceae bacterium]|nr:hypothetical protein [Lachnospiraceae bacterium]MBQ5484563.1 hypothetical protein [Lachnospiraceae bacterium]
MQEIMEQYGEGILATLCLAGVLAVCAGIFLCTTGPLGELFLRYTGYLL